jgi:hypothetical protein
MVIMRPQMQLSKSTMLARGRSSPHFNPRRPHRPPPVHRAQPVHNKIQILPKEIHKVAIRKEIHKVAVRKEIHKVAIRKGIHKVAVRKEIHKVAIHKPIHKAIPKPIHLLIKVESPPHRRPAHRPALVRACLSVREAPLGQTYWAVTNPTWLPS